MKVSNGKILHNEGVHGKIIEFWLEESQQAMFDCRRATSRGSKGWMTYGHS